MSECLVNCQVPITRYEHNGVWRTNVEWTEPSYVQCQLSMYGVVVMFLHYSNSAARRPSRQPSLNRRVAHLPVNGDRAVIYGTSSYVIRDMNLHLFTFEGYQNLVGTIDFHFFFFISVFFWMVTFGGVWAKLSAKLSFFMFRLRISRAPALPVCNPAKMAHGLITTEQSCIVGQLSNNVDTGSHRVVEWCLIYYNTTEKAKHMRKDKYCCVFPTIVSHRTRRVNQQVRAKFLKFSSHLLAYMNCWIRTVIAFRIAEGTWVQAIDENGQWEFARVLNIISDAALVSFNGYETEHDRVVPRWRSGPLWLTTRQVRLFIYLL